MLRIDCIDERPGVAPRLAVRLTVPRLAITTRDLIRARIELEVERLQAELSALGADESGPRTTQGDWLVRPDAVDEPIDLGDTGEVVFLRLIPMAGG